MLSSALTLIAAALSTHARSTLPSNKLASKASRRRLSMPSVASCKPSPSPSLNPVNLAAILLNNPAATLPNKVILPNNLVNPATPLNSPANLVNLATLPNNPANLAILLNKVRSHSALKQPTNVRTGFPPVTVAITFQQFFDICAQLSLVKSIFDLADTDRDGRVTYTWDQLAFATVDLNA